MRFIEIFHRERRLYTIIHNQSDNLGNEITNNINVNALRLKNKCQIINFMRALKSINMIVHSLIHSFIHSYPLYNIQFAWRHLNCVCACATNKSNKRLHSLPFPSHIRCLHSITIFDYFMCAFRLQWLLFAFQKPFSLSLTRVLIINKQIFHLCKKA